MAVITNLLESDMSFILIGLIGLICFSLLNLVVDIIVVELEVRAEKIGTDNAYIAAFYAIAFIFILGFIRRIIASRD